MTAFQHGTPGAYTNHHCRCVRCRKGWCAYNRRNRQQRAARGICIQCHRRRYRRRHKGRIVVHVRCKQHHDEIPKRTGRITQRQT